MRRVYVFIIVFIIEIFIFQANDFEYAAITDYQEEYNSVCKSNWQKRYENLHKKIVSGDIAGKYIVAVPVLAGLADILLGYVSAFMWALLTDSAFFILRVDPFFDFTQRNIEMAYHSPFINWVAPSSIDKSIYGCMMPRYHKTFNCSDSNLVNMNRRNSSELSRVWYVSTFATGLFQNFLRNDRYIAFYEFSFTCFCSLEYAHLSSLTKIL